MNNKTEEMSELVETLRAAAEKAEPITLGICKASTVLHPKGTACIDWELFLAPAAKEDGIPEEPLCMKRVPETGEACVMDAGHSGRHHSSITHPLKSVASLQEPEGELRHAMDSTIPFAELFERSKDDRAIIVGSEVREVIGAYRRCLASLGDVEAELRKLRSQEGK
jgi:hypothetical protein